MKYFKTLVTYVALLIIAACLFNAVHGQKPPGDLKPTLILISIDGLRYDYLEKFNPPVLNQLAREGVRAKWMIPSFPTKTFPNHYTVATGLYPAHHGIIENNIWDFGTTFSLGNHEELQNARWWLGEPIWVTAEKQGQRAAAYFFPGTEAPIMGIRPSYWKEYVHTTPHDERVGTILNWLDMPADQRPTVYTLYFSDVDDAGHGYSPDSAQTRDAVLKVDAAIGRIIDGLRARRIDSQVNLIIVSDHGMATVDQRNAVIMDDYFDFDKADRILTSGEIYQIFPKPGQEGPILKSLNPVKHVRCWRKSEIPKRLHYRDSPRIAPIVCLADEGWFMTDTKRYEAQKKRADFTRLKGAHGYDNKYESMRATFIAHGPAFKQNKVYKPFVNIHVYELMCGILGLRPAKNDGDLDKVDDMLRE